MGFASKYLSKQNCNYLFSTSDILGEVGVVVVIPCYNEPDIKHTILSLFSCNNPRCKVVIVVVVNDSDKTTHDIRRQNQISIDELKQLKQLVPSWGDLVCIEALGLPYKHAGVGWARKIGMDFAIMQFNEQANEQGIIVSLDADTTVQANYFEAITAFFNTNTKAVGATLYFEHRTNDSLLEQAANLYELHMRYYKHAIAQTGFPHSIYAVGSAFCVKASAYVAQGGMNRKKAGEDFYFLHKLVQLGEVGEIVNTIVFPSARISNRVPFGTGPSIAKYIDSTDKNWLTFPISAILILKQLFDKKHYAYENELFSVDDLVEDRLLRLFLISCNFIDNVKMLKSNCGCEQTFSKRFFHVFNAFQILKWLNFALSNGFEKKELLNETQNLLSVVYPEQLPCANAKIMLNQLRALDKCNFN